MEKTVEKILSIISHKPEVSASELVVLTGFSRQGIEWNLKKLKADGRLHRIGPDKGGHWEILPCPPQPTPLSPNKT